MMLDNGFVPFEPRRLTRKTDSASAGIDTVSADRRGAQPQEPETATEVEMATDSFSPEGSERAESDTGGVDVSTNGDADNTDTGRADDSGHAPDASVVHICADADVACIRATAIRIAAAACARALRYAVDRNPRLVARFVDEALRAAGGPRDAIVRVAPAVASAGVASRDHDLVADLSLSPGDVFIDCAAGTLGATLDERAELLVRGCAS
jgi:hypothetical protein